MCVTVRVNCCLKECFGRVFLSGIFGVIHLRSGSCILGAWGAWELLRGLVRVTVASAGSLSVL